MNVQQFRGAVNALIDAWRADYEDTEHGIARGSLPVFYENGPQPANPAGLRVWLDVTLRFYGSHSASVGGQDGRYTGAISIAVYTHGGDGSLLSDRILGSLTRLLRTRKVGRGARTQYPARMIPPPFAQLGWHRSGLLISFVLYEFAPDLP